MKVDPPPNAEVLQKRREPKYVVDPKDVAAKDEMRVREWGLSIMQKYESKLNSKVPNKTIVYEKEVEPEEIDIKNVYPFKNLRWFIMKLGNQWALRLLYKTPSGKHSILAELRYVTIEHI